MDCKSGLHLSAGAGEAGVNIKLNKSMIAEQPGVLRGCYKWMEGQNICQRADNERKSDSTDMRPPGIY